MFIVMQMHLEKSEVASNAMFIVMHMHLEKSEVSL